jgi:hypothetical protein
MGSETVRTTMLSTMLTGIVERGQEEEKAAIAVDSGVGPTDGLIRYASEVSMRVLVLLCSAAMSASLMACATAEVDLPTDADHDGMLSDAEAAAGTDPNNADSDGDGHSDGAEVDAGHDPMDPEDHPYLGGYAINRCDADPVASGGGGSIGDIFSDFQLMDQFGEEVSLYDFCGNYVYIEAGTFW